MTADHQAVARANQLFYQVFQEADQTRMAGLWLRDKTVKCTHPGWDVLMGWEEVGESWAEIFASGQRLQARPTQVAIHLAADFASVSCLEELTIFDEEADASITVVLSASNLFQRVGNEWLMIHHHASPQFNPAPIVTSERIQ